MKRLFVSLPMKGKTDDEIKKGIREAYEEEEKTNDSMDKIPEEW